MLIKEINHKPELKIKDAIISLSYEEIRDIANVFIYISHRDNKDFKPTDSEMKSFKQREQDFNILFDIVKNGSVAQTVIDRYAKCPDGCVGTLTKYEKIEMTSK